MSNVEPPRDRFKKGGNPADANLDEQENALDETLETLHTRYRPGVFTQDDDRVPGRARDLLNPGDKAPTNQFPARLVRADPYDDKAALKASLVHDKSGATPFGLATLTERDLEWIDSKRKMQNNLALIQFMDNYFDMTNPAIQRMVEQMLPEYFERRQRMLDDVAQLQKQLAELRMYGPRSREDLVTMFAVRSGAVHVPTGPLWEPEKWYGSKGTFEEEYKRGLLNLKGLWSAKMPARDAASRMDGLNAADGPSLWNDGDAGNNWLASIFGTEGQKMKAFNAPAFQWFQGRPGVGGNARKVG